MLAQTCLHSILPILLSDSVQGAPSGCPAELFQEDSALPLQGSGRQQHSHYPVVTICLPHSTGSLSSEFSSPRSKLPMVFPFFLDFARTRSSRRLSQTRLDPPSGLQSIPRQLASLAQRQRQKHSAWGSSLGPVHPLPSQSIRVEGGGAAPSSLDHSLLQQTLMAGGGVHVCRRNVCPAQSSLVGRAFQESQGFSKDRVW